MLTGKHSLRSLRLYQLRPAIGPQPKCPELGRNAALKRRADEDVDEMNDSEFLTHEEIVEVTGYKNATGQRSWLDQNGWSYVINAANRPIVGRWFARMRLAGLKPATDGFVIQSTARPNFAALK